MTSRERAENFMEYLFNQSGFASSQNKHFVDELTAAIDEAVAEAFEEAATRYRLTAEQTRFANQPDIIDRCKVVALAMSEEAAAIRARRKP